MTRSIYNPYSEELDRLSRTGSLRHLPAVKYDGRHIISDGRTMLNLSSNDYLGLNCIPSLLDRFEASGYFTDRRMSSSSSRLLTGNFEAYTALEKSLAGMFGRESALVFNSGYHMNAGILPAITDNRTLILADKLVHASIIDGIRLSSAKCIRYRHQDYTMLESLLEKNAGEFSRIIIVTESIFSMDGDLADLRRLTGLRKHYGNIMLYVDEAHAVGVRGECGLGLAEETGCIQDIDILCGTFGKALCSVGAYAVCSGTMKEYLINRMRPLIFTTALPPVNIAWTMFILDLIPGLGNERKHLENTAAMLRKGLEMRGYRSDSSSHIVPMTIGENSAAVKKAEELQRAGFYVLPVRPPTVPEGTARLRFSLTADIGEDEIRRLLEAIDTNTAGI